MAVSKFGSSILSMGTFYLRQTHIPRKQVGGVNACLRMMFMSATPISCLVQPHVVEHLGALTSFILGAICLWALVWYSNRVARAYMMAIADSIAETKAAA